MATYTLSRKLPSMDSYTVTDESGAVVLAAKHHMGLGKEHWDLTDPAGNPAGSLLHESFHTHATYILSRPGQPDLTLIKVNWMPVAETWKIQGGQGEQVLNGDLGDYRWDLADGSSGAIWAQFQRKLVSLHSQYHITTETDPMLPTVLALAVDNENEQHRR